MPVFGRAPGYKLLPGVFPHNSVSLQYFSIDTFTGYRLFIEVVHRMLKQSVITKSGQLWKLAVAVVVLLVGSFAPLYPVTGISWTSGTVIVVVG